MADRAEEAISALEAKLAALERQVATTSDADWVKVCPDETWMVGLVAFHIARGFQRQAEFVEAARDGRGPHRFDWGDTHALNASVAVAHASPSRDEVLALARASVERMRVALRSMPMEALERIAFTYENSERSVVWVVGSLAVRHAQGHLDSIARAVA